jgi:hypothetical protein
MGHDIHFLQRIERLSPAQADLALTLYREPELVAHILERVRLPDGAERVALALEEAPRSPHIIVTREGRFVTCLGAGMSVADCPVVSRPQIDHASEKIEAMRATLAGGSSETRRLYRRLIQRGSGVSREDFMAMATLTPILGDEYIDMAVDICRFLVRFHNTYRPGRYRKLTPAARDELQLYWASTWALGHLAAICGERTDDMQAIAARRGEQIFQRCVETLLLGAMFSNATPVVLRGVWTVSRAGRALLPWTRQRLQEARTITELLLAGMPLTAIGLRHRRTQGEVSKALARSRRSLETPDPSMPDRAAMHEVVKLLEELLDPAQQESLRTQHRDIGARSYLRYTEYLPDGAPLRFTRAEDVPDELALPMLMHLHGAILREGKDIVLALMMMPWLATADGPSLYLPAQLLDQCRSLFEPEAIIERLDGYRRAGTPAGPARAAARPGRNEPCSCGSGKKYKRCCGAAA